MDWSKDLICLGVINVVILVDAIVEVQYAIVRGRKVLRLILYNTC